ncbi:MAG TPA: NmrA/HSCARG family protein [Candidatus Eisenbacteria bacterium]|nr:NmrA/HSCARG family protein [Candidatus Eisenbacteria bacterium]
MALSNELILITGATGQQGGAIAHELLVKGRKIRAMTRHPESPKAAALKRLGAEVVAGDLNDAASIERALHGAWGAFALQNTWEAGIQAEEEQGIRFAEIARKAGIHHLVYSSVQSADRKTGIPHFDNKARVEARIRSLGFPSYAILRPVFFMENLTSPWFLPSIQSGALAVGIRPETELQMVAVKDIGQYGAWAFESHASLNGRAIDIAGDELTMPETAAVLSRVAGREIRFVQVPIEEVRKFSDDFAKMLEWFDRVGYNVDIAAQSAESGVRPTPFAEWAAAADWQPAPATR